jgi:hypothetical protein
VSPLVPVRDQPRLRERRDDVLDRGEPPRAKRHVSAVVFVGYLCLSILLYGRQALGDPSHIVVGSGQTHAFYGRDQSAYVWFLAWGAHALTHLQSPFLTSEVYAPSGYNLAWATSIPGPALLLAPVTLLVGAVVTFNILALLAPATAAWTTYLLCRQVTRRLSSAVAGGLLVGFGTYETVEMVNHLSLALVALLPLSAWIVLRRYAGAISRSRFILALGMVLGLQLWTSTELFASSILFGTAAIAIAVGVGRGRVWPRARVLIVEMAGALAVAALLGAPYLYYVFAYPNPLAGHSAVEAGADLAGFVVPTRATWLHGYGALAAAADHLKGNLTEQPAYIGPALLAVLIMFTFSFRRRLLGKCVILFMLVALLCSLGAHLVVGGETTQLGLPWGVVGELPLIGHALPDRFVIYLWIAAAVAVALWLDQARRRAGRWLLFGLVAVSLAPNLSGLPWGTRIDSPALMSNGALARYVPTGATVLALPFGSFGDSMYWQVESGFRFRLAGGYVSWALPTDYQGLSIIHELTGRPPGGDERRRLCAFIALTHAELILLREHTPGAWQSILAPLRVSPERSGGFLIYPLSTVRETRHACHT